MTSSSTSTPLRIVVASKNPIKIQAALSGFQQSFPQTTFEAVGIDADSGVSDQPASDEETQRGADNRAAAAESHEPGADYWIGIEGGIETINDEMYAFAWISIRSHQRTGSKTGRSRSGAFLLPPKVQQLIGEGMELGHANDIVFAQHNSKQQGGAIGLLTGDAIGRQQLYEHAVVLALVPFISRELFPVSSDVAVPMDPHS